MFTKKDFAAVAAIIASFQAEGETRVAVKMTVKFSDLFAQSNPRFDRERFLAAALPLKV